MYSWRSAFHRDSRREKTGLWGFRPGLTQADLYSHRSRLELSISDLWRRGIVLSLWGKQRRWSAMQLLHSWSASLFSHRQNPVFLRRGSFLNGGFEHFQHFLLNNSVKKDCIMPPTYVVAISKCTFTIIKPCDNVQENRMRQNKAAIGYVFFFQYLSLIKDRSFIHLSKKGVLQYVTFEPPHGKTNNLHMRKQRRRSASRLLSAKLISAFVFATRIVQFLSS